VWRARTLISLKRLYCYLDISYIYIYVSAALAQRLRTYVEVTLMRVRNLEWHAKRVCHVHTLRLATYVVYADRARCIGGFTALVNFPPEQIQ